MGPVSAPGPQPINLEGAEAATFFDAVGGHETFEALVSGFYARVAHDAVLRPLYDGHDYGDAARRLQLFLEQYRAARAPTRRSAVTLGYGRGTPTSGSTVRPATRGWRTCGRRWTTSTSRRKLIGSCGTT